MSDTGAQEVRQAKITDHIEEIYSQGGQPEIIMQKLKGINDKKILESIIDEFNFDVNYNDTELLIHFCSRRHRTNIAQMLLDYGANARVGNDVVFISACQFGDYNLIKRLLDMGVPANAGGGRALKCALYKQNYETIKLILDNGYDLTSIEPIEGNTVLMRCIERCRPEILKLLLDYGIDPNVLNASEPKERDSEDDSQDDSDDELEKYVEMTNILLSYGVPIGSIVKCLIKGLRGE